MCKSTHRILCILRLYARRKEIITHTFSNPTMHSLKLRRLHILCSPRPSNEFSHNRSNPVCIHSSGNHINDQTNCFVSSAQSMDHPDALAAPPASSTKQVTFFYLRFWFPKYAYNCNGNCWCPNSKDDIVVRFSTGSDVKTSNDAFVKFRKQNMR